MQKCNIDFNTGLVKLGSTILDCWTDEVFMKRVFGDFAHTHDFTGAAVYESPIMMRLDDCIFNRIMVVFHKKHLDLPPVIKEIYFFMNERPDWSNNKLFHLVQKYTNGPAVRPGSTYRITNSNVDILASDAFGGRDAHIRLRYNNAAYSYNRTLTPEQLQTASIRAGVIRLNGMEMLPGMKVDLRMVMRQTRSTSYLDSDFMDEPLSGQAEIHHDETGKIREILFRCNGLGRISSGGDSTWMHLHLGGSDDDLIIHTANGRVSISPRALGLKITYF